jgi:hypothetical protein
MGSFQLGRIKRQLRTIEAANIRIRDLFPLVYPSIGRIQTGRPKGGYFCSFEMVNRTGAAATATTICTNIPTAV